MKRTNKELIELCETQLIHGVLNSYAFQELLIRFKSFLRLVPPAEQVQHKPRVFSLDELREAFEAARLHHPLAGIKYDRFEDFVKERHGIFIPLTLSDKIQAITGNAEMTNQILKVVEGERG